MRTFFGSLFGLPMVFLLVLGLGGKAQSIRGYTALGLSSIALCMVGMRIIRGPSKRVRRGYYIRHR